MGPAGSGKVIIIDRYFIYITMTGKKDRSYGRDLYCPNDHYEKKEVNGEYINAIIFKEEKRGF